MEKREGKAKKVKKVRRLKGEKVRVALGLSGGVDSAVSAYLLKKQGFDVSCVYLNCFDSDIPGCHGDTDRKDALEVAMCLGLPFQVLDFRKEYQAAVIDYFKKEYLSGRTPNPDVVCNRDIKFGLFLDWSIKEGFDYVATGHYAKLDDRRWKIEDSDNKKMTIDDREMEDGGRKWKVEGGKNRNRQSIFNHPSSTTTLGTLPSIVSADCSLSSTVSAVFLARPADLHKDQTYFLWAVPKEKFKRVLFPLGNLLKTEVREIARQAGLSVASKKDSTGICFVGEVRVEEFLKRLGVKERLGDVVIKTTVDDRKIEDGCGKLKIEDRKSEVDQSIFNPPSSTTTFHHPSSIVSSTSFKVIGHHRGVWFYTIGQRHGFSTDLRSSKNRDKGQGLRAKGQANADSLSPQPLAFSPSLDRPPLYVIEKDIKKNRLVVGFGTECYKSEFEIWECNWLVSEKAWPCKARPGLNKFACFVRLRHCGELIPAILTIQPSNHSAIVSLRSAQRGIAPGQSAVFYDKNGIVLGGGVIQ